MRHRVVHLGPYRKWSELTRIEDGVVIAGRDRASPGRFHTHAAVWTDPRAGGAGWELLPDLTSRTQWSVALGGSRRAQHVVGDCLVADDATDTRPVLWTRGARGRWRVRELPLPESALTGSAASCNATGDAAVGWAGFNVRPEVRPMLWTRQSRGRWQVQTLPALGGPRSGAWDFGAWGAVIGGSMVAPRRSWQATAWRRTGQGRWHARRLGLLPLAPGTDPARVESIAWSARGGRTAGSCAVKEGGAPRAVIWDTAGRPTDLGAGDGTELYGVRGSRAVGWRAAPNSENKLMGRAMYWSRRTGIVDIHPPGWKSSWADDIDNRGRIVGVGHDGEGLAMFLLVPIRG